MTTIRQRLTAVALASGLLVGALVAPVAASTDTETPTTRPTVTTTQPDATDRNPGTDSRHLRCPQPDPTFGRGALSIAAAVIGIDLRDLARLMASGASIADVAIDHGVDPSEVIHAVAAPIHSAIDRLVEAGCVRPVQGERMKAAATARATHFVWSASARGVPGDCENRFDLRPPSLRSAFGTAARLLEMDVADLAALVGDGSSIAEIATRMGVDPFQVVRAIVAPGHAAIDRLVEAGCLRPAHGDRLKAMWTAAASRIVHMTGFSGGRG